jgi:putative SOS response-associated peptidase YedK
MCGRATQTKKRVPANHRFAQQVNEAGLEPNYNIGPGQEVAVITSEQPDHVQYLTWGWQVMVQHHPKLLVNAKADSLLERKSYKPLLEAGQTCLVLADSFYEWKPLSKSNRIPYRILLQDNDLFAIAGLYKNVVDPETGEETKHFTVITTEANKLVSSIHERMPVILPKGTEMDWLKMHRNPEEYLQMLKPLDPGLMQAYTVSKDVGKISNNSPDLIKPFQYPTQPEQLNLF